MRRISRCAAGALAVLVLGGCSTAAVDGQGSVAAPSGSITAFPSSSTGASTSKTPPAPSTSSPAKTSEPPAPAVKICPSRSNPPFCYSLPEGFRDYSKLTSYGKGWMYRTLVSVGRHDLVEVLASRENHSYDGLSNRQLTSYFDRSLRARRGHYSVRRAGPVKRVRVDGARAFEQHVVFKDGVRGDTTTAFRAHSIVSIGCQSQTHEAQVHTACGRVHHTIQIG